MSTTRRVTVNFPDELYQAAIGAIDGVHFVNVTQVVLVAVDNLIRQVSSSPLSPPTPPSNPTPYVSPPNIPLQGIYTPPLGEKVQTPERAKVSAVPKEYTQEFSGFWSLYPRKVQKRHAFKAYWSALRVTTHEKILSGLEEHIDKRVWKDRDFIPYPATWLNRGGWELEEARPKSRKKKAPEVVDHMKALDGPSCDLWVDSMEQFYDELGAYDVRDWLSPIRAVVSGGTLVLGCPDTAHAGWLTKNYRDVISNVVGIRWRAVDAEEFAGLGA